MRFGERMQACREALGMTRPQLAALLGVSPSAVSNYEKNISFPKEEVMLRLFDCLETDPNTLFQDSFRAGAGVLSQPERQLLERYRGLSPVGRETVRSVVDALCAYRDDLEGRGPGSSRCTAARRRRATRRRCSARISTTSPWTTPCPKRRSSLSASGATPWPPGSKTAAWPT